MWASSTLIVLLSLLTVGTSLTVTDADLAKFSQTIWNKDVNKVLGVKVNVQGRSVQGQDKASRPLFASVPRAALQKDTYKKLIALFDNYEMNGLTQETSNRKERNEINAFIEAIGKTEVIKLTHKFLSSKGLVSRNYQSFLQGLKTIWFDMYSPDKNHKNILGSSGFEHVFLGEIKKNQLKGQHNWINFYLNENNKANNYYGHKKKLIPANGLKYLKFTAYHGKYTKPVNSMLIGTSPEFEIALYTTCFYARENGICKVPINGKKLMVKSFVLRNKGRKLIASAFPDL